MLGILFLVIVLGNWLLVVFVGIVIGSINACIKFSLVTNIFVVYSYSYIACIQSCNAERFLRYIFEIEVKSFSSIGLCVAC